MSGGLAIQNLVIWNAVVGAVLGGVYGVILHLLIGRGGAGRAALKTIGIVLLTGATTPYVGPALRGVAAPILPKSRVERAVESFEARLAALPEWQERTRGRSRKGVLDIRRTMMGLKRADDEHACGAARTLYY